MEKIEGIRLMKGEEVYGQAQEGLSWVDGCLYADVYFDPGAPLASPRGEGFEPAAINSPLFCLFSLQSSLLRFKELKIIHNFSFLIRPCRMFV